MVDIVIYSAITTIQALSDYTSFLELRGVAPASGSIRAFLEDPCILNNARTGSLPRHARFDDVAPRWKLSTESLVLAPSALRCSSRAGSAPGISGHHVSPDR